jgi:hypothetical protein
MIILTEGVEKKTLLHLGVRISRFGPTRQVSYPVQPALFFLFSLSSQFLGYNSISQFLI